MSVDSVPSGKVFKFNSKTQAAVHQSVVLYLKSQAGRDLLKQVTGEAQKPGTYSYNTFQMNLDLDPKMVKKDRRDMKEEIAKSVITSVMESIDQKIQNEVEKASVELNLKDAQGPDQSDLTAKMDQFDLKHEKMDKKVDDLILDLARMSDKVVSANDRSIRLEEWKDSGLFCSKEELFLFAWGMACVQTR